MVHLFVQTVQIFACFSIQTIQTLNFIFVLALLLIKIDLKDAFRLIPVHPS